ncbi:hypothetical protein ACFLXX_00385 [Chloroflexota bacterium]
MSDPPRRWGNAEVVQVTKAAGIAKATKVTKAAGIAKATKVTKAAGVTKAAVDNTKYMGRGYGKKPLGSPKVGGPGKRQPPTKA